MARPEQEGIKWWKCCPTCLWAANTKNADNDNPKCPNCNNPNLDVCTDFEVFRELRYDVSVRNDRQQVVADQVRQDAGRPPAPPDTVNTQNQGFNYGSGPRPFPP